MEAGPSKSTMTKIDIHTVLNPFLTVLRSSAPITIPPPTLLGAITHFLSTLDNADLYDFIYAFLTSPSLWSFDPAAASQSEIQEAVRLSVSAKLASIEKDVEDRYFPQVRTRARAREWLGRIIQPASDISKPSKSNQNSILAFHIALLEGMNDVRVDWGNARIKIEEEIVLALCDDSQDKNVHLACAALPHVDIERLKALDIKRLLSVIEDRLVQELGMNGNDGKSRGTLTTDIPRTAKALARCLSVLNSDAKDKKYAWGAMMRFCRRLHDLGIQGSNKWYARDSESSDELCAKHKLSLFAFLLPSSTILDILLHSDFPPSLLTETNVHPSADLAGHVIWALSAFSYLTDSASAGIENYHRILYGHLDVLAAKGGVNATDKLFHHLLDDLNGSDGKDEAKVAYVLVIGEELKNMLSGTSIGPLLSLAEKYVHRLEHQASFEASHAFLLGLLRSSAQSSSSLSSQHLGQGAFFDALLPFYLSRLTKQFVRNQITSDQFRSAYPLIAESASIRSPASTQYVLSTLAQLPPSADKRMIHMKIAPCIPSDQLVDYLDNLADMIVTVEEGSEERLDLVRGAFKLVIEDLGDDVKGLGVDWWIKWREQLEGKRKVDQGFIRSRL